MLGPVSAWVSDRLWTGKPSWCRTRHPGLLSLSLPSVVRLEWVSGKSWGVNRHIAWYTSPYLWSCSVCWCLAVGLTCGDQRWRTGSGSKLEVLHDNTLYKNTFTLLYFTLLRSTTVENVEQPEEQEPEVLCDETRRAVNKLENNKAPGIDNISAEMLKAGKPQLQC